MESWPCEAESLFKCIVSALLSVLFFFFFFQAEDGIRDGRVTGVQTCALPIFESLLAEILSIAARSSQRDSRHAPPWLPRILDKLQTEHCRRLTLDELAREAAVHPVHLSRVFRGFVGEGIGEHVHRPRVRTAC